MWNDTDSVRNFKIFGFIYLELYYSFLNYDIVGVLQTYMHHVLAYTEEDNNCQIFSNLIYKHFFLSTFSFSFAMIGTNFLH